MAPPVDRELLEVAVSVMVSAGELTLRWFGSGDLAVDTKADGSPVTAADRAAERSVRDALATRFPDDGVVGEEEADRPGSSGRTWVVDPIDGTKAFTRGVPLYSNLLALDDEHGPAVGVINLPALGQVVAAGRGLGCFHNGVPCKVSATARLHAAYAATSGLETWEPAVLARLVASGLVVRTWGDGYGYALVATGRIDAMLDPVVAPYDVAPMRIILAEAGGRFSDFAGASGADGGTGLASNGRLHDALLALVAPRGAETGPR